MTDETVLLVYDKACPACNLYCQLVKVRELGADLQLINARDDHPVVSEITERGWDIDQGMVLKLHGELFYGADAIHALALISSQAGWFNRINYWMFRSKNLSKVLYPVFKAGRNVLLKMKGVDKINNLDLPNNDRF